MTAIAPPPDTIAPPLTSSVCSSDASATPKEPLGIASITRENLDEACLKETSYADSYATSQTSSVHAFCDAERVAFVKHINKVLDEPTLFVEPEGDAIFDAVKDGVLLCKLINATVPGTIDDDAVNVHFDERKKTYQYISNHNLCLDGARKIGAVIVNIGAEDLLEAKPYLVFGIIWQIIKIGLLKEVTIEAHPELMRLKEGEEDLSNLPAEELLLKWFNWHLKKVDGNGKVKNLSSDLCDSANYIKLMHTLAPEQCSLAILEEPDLLKRAEIVLATAESLGCKTYIAPEDIVSGNDKLNLVFVASMFNKHTGMASITQEYEDENRQLREENAVLQEQLNDLKKECERLKNEKTAFESTMTKEKETMQSLLRQTEEKNDKLMEDLAAMVRKKISFSERLSEMEKLSDGKEKQIIGLNSEIGRLNASLKQECEKVESLTTAKLELECTVKNQQVELKELHDEIKKHKISLEMSESSGLSLANDLETLRCRHEKLEFLIEHLKIERTRSEMHAARLRILYRSFESNESLCQAIYGSLELGKIAVGASKSGYLTKKARNTKSWKYRYFVLRDNFLFYYRSDKDNKATPSGIIRVDDAILRFAENPTRTDLKDQWLLCIEVPNNNDVIKNSEFYIAGEDSELDGWMNQIKAAAGWWTKKTTFSSIKRTINSNNNQEGETAVELSSSPSN